jgi:hypothetical protein
MTSEKRTLIAPLDILSLGFECLHCRATYFVPIDKLDRSLPRTCQNCQESILTDAPVTNSSWSDLQALTQFIALFKLLRTRPFGSAVRFEIREEPL